MARIKTIKQKEKTSSEVAVKESKPAEPSAPPAKQESIKSFFARKGVQDRFRSMLGTRAASFMTSVLHIVSNDAKLAKADPMSVYQAAAVAATLGLPLNDSLGFAYIVPYNMKQKDGTYQVVGTLQIGWKGYVQLSLRSNQFKTLAATHVCEGQITSVNPLDGYKFDFTNKKSDVIVGYAAKFALTSGFEATWYMSVDELKAHALKYSQSFKKGYGLWKDDFHSMSIKTVIKLLLSKYAPLSVDMERALLVDQAVINDYETIDVSYIDNEPESMFPLDKEAERAVLMIDDATTTEELLKIQPFVKEEQMQYFNNKLESLKK